MLDARQTNAGIMAKQQPKRICLANIDTVFYTLLSRVTAEVCHRMG